MADQGFNKIFVLIAMVLLQTSPGSGTDVFYYEVNSLNDFAIRIQNVVQDTDPFVMISFFYNTESSSAFVFFTINSRQLRDASKCPGVQFHFSPCSVLKNTPNYGDRTHACVAKTFPKKGDPIPFMEFILCYFSTNKSNQQHVDGCLRKIHMEGKKDVIHDCVAGKDVYTDCLLYSDDFRIANDEKGNPISAIEDFQNELCKNDKNLLGAGPLKCPAFCTKKY